MEIEWQRGKKGTMKCILLQSFFMHYFVCVYGRIFSACWRQGMLSGWDPPCCCQDTWCLSVGYGSLQPPGTFWAHLLWRMPLASAAQQPGVSRWWGVSVLVGRKHFLLPLIVCEASDGCDSPSLTVVLPGALTFDLEEEWIYLSHSLLLRWKLENTRLRFLLGWNLGGT